MEPITIDSIWWRPDGRRANAFLKGRGVEFQEVNIEEDLEGREIVLRENKGRRKVPTLKEGERYFACSPFPAYQLAAEVKIPLNQYVTTSRLDWQSTRVDPGNLQGFIEQYEVGIGIRV